MLLHGGFESLTELVVTRLKDEKCEIFMKNYTGAMKNNEGTDEWLRFITVDFHISELKRYAHLLQAHWISIGPMVAIALCS